MYIWRCDANGKNKNWMEKHIRLLGNEVYHSWINNTHRVHLCTYVLKQEKMKQKDKIQS